MQIIKGLLIVLISIVNFITTNSIQQQAIVEFTYEKNTNITVDNTNKLSLPIGSQLNIICNLKNPPYGSYLNITKTSHQTHQHVQFIEPSFFQGYQLGSHFKNNSRYSLSSSDFPNITLIGSIKQVQFNDNGKYSCLLSQRNTLLIDKEIDVVVYKPLEVNQLSILARLGLNNTNIHHDHGKLAFNLGETYRILCVLHEVFPKPMITITLNNKEEQFSEDLNLAKDSLHYHRIVASFNYTAKSNDHEQDLVCNALSPIKTEKPISKKAKIEIQGIEIKQNECSPHVIFNNDDGSALITCEFYSYPASNVKWLINEIEMDDAQNDSFEIDDEYDTDSSSSSSNSGTSSNATTLKLTSHIDYLTKGIYRATLKFSSGLKINALPTVALQLTKKDSLTSYSTTTVNFTLTSKENANLLISKGGDANSNSSNNSYTRVYGIIIYLFLITAIII